MLAYLPLVIIIVALAFAVFANSRWAGEHGWVYNKHNPRPPGVGYTPGPLEKMLHPGIEYVIEEQESERLRGDQDESGSDL